jgi:hypothetical protein
MSANKPPLGLVPKYIHDSQRGLAIIQAMDRYAIANMQIPLEWAQELYDLTRDAQENPHATD